MSSHACWIWFSVPFSARSSMVVIFFAPTEFSGTWHERVATPSICTVQAPHWAMPQPYLVPVSPTVSRRTQSSGVRGSAFAWTDFPLMLRTAMASLLQRSVIPEPGSPSPSGRLRVVASFHGCVISLGDAGLAEVMGAPSLFLVAKLCRTRGGFVAKCHLAAPPYILIRLQVLNG